MANKRYNNQLFKDLKSKGVIDDKTKVKDLKKISTGIERPKKMAGGMMKKRSMLKSGSLKPVDKEKNPGLAKLPTKVRNKMGFLKDGGRVNKMGGGMMKKRSMLRHGSKDPSVAKDLKKMTKELDGAEKDMKLSTTGKTKNKNFKMPKGEIFKMKKDKKIKLRCG